MGHLLGWTARRLETAAVVAASVALAGAVVLAALWPALGEAQPPLATPTPTPAGDWPMFRGNLQRTGVAATTVKPSLPLEKKWEFQTGDRVFSSPAVWEGMVFVGSEDGKVYAFGPAPGAVPYPTPTPTPTATPTPTPTPVPLVVRVGGGSAALGTAVLAGVPLLALFALTLGLISYRIHLARERERQARLLQECTRVQGLLEKVRGWKAQGYRGRLMEEAEQRLLDAFRSLEEQMAGPSRRRPASGK